MTVELRPGESHEHLLRRFRQEASGSGVLRAVRRKRWFVSESEQRRQAKARAIRKARRRRNRSRSNRRGRGRR